MSRCPIEECSALKDVKDIVDKKVSLKELSIVACIVAVCIASVVTVYGYVVGGSLAEVERIKAQVIETKIMATESKVEIINIKESLLTKEEFKSIVKEAVKEATR